MGKRRDQTGCRGRKEFLPGRASVGRTSVGARRGSSRGLRLGERVDHLNKSEHHRPHTFAGTLPTVSPLLAHASLPNLAVGTVVASVRLHARSPGSARLAMSRLLLPPPASRASQPASHDLDFVVSCAGHPSPAASSPTLYLPRHEGPPQPRTAGFLIPSSDVQQGNLRIPPTDIQHDRSGASRLLLFNVLGARRRRSMASHSASSSAARR